MLYSFYVRMGFYSNFPRTKLKIVRKRLRTGANLVRSKALVNNRSSGAIGEANTLFMLLYVCHFTNELMSVRVDFEYKKSIDHLY